MAKPRDIINQAVTDLTKQLRDIKQADEDDLGKAADAFDQVAQAADDIASKLNDADQALAGDNKPAESQDNDGEDDGQKS